jgi:hypothetical protein
LLDGGKRLGTSFERFKRTYFYAEDYMEYNWKVKPEGPAKIQALIEDITCTLRACDYLDVADIVREEHEVALTPDAKVFYNTLEAELLATLKEGGPEVVALSAGVLVNKLLQVTSGNVYLEDHRILPIHVQKADKARRLVVKNDTPSLIVCQYQHEQAMMHSYITGSTRFDSAKTPKEQAKLEAAWNAGKIPALICHPASMGHGLNMQEGGRHIIWATPTYSGELYDQLNARLHRTGQKDQVVVQHIVVPNSIDEAVMDALSQKAEGQAQLVNVLAALTAIK